MKTPSAMDASIDLNPTGKDLTDETPFDEKMNRHRRFKNLDEIDVYKKRRRTINS